MPVPSMTLTQFLVFAISGPGVAAILSLSIQHIPYLGDWLAGRTPDGKRVFFLGASLAVPLAATAGMIALGQAQSTPDTWFAALAAGGLGYVASTAAYLAQKVAGKTFGVRQAWDR